MKIYRGPILTIVLLAFLYSCHTMKKLEKIELPAFDKEGHRGCRGLMPENSIPAMLKALELGVTTLEMDAVITKDKHVILSHEPFFNKDITTKKDGTTLQEGEEKTLNIFNMTYAETQQLDVGLKPHPKFPQQQKINATKPLLSEVIDDVEATIQLKNLKKVFYNIETKTQPSTDGVFHPAPEEFVKTLMGVIEKKKIQNRVIIQSFDFRTLQYLHQNYPTIYTSALVEPTDTRSFQQQLDDLGFIPTVYSPYFSKVTLELLKECHDRNIKVIPWTVNDKASIERLKAMGVDGIISDYPDLFNN